MMKRYILFLMSLGACDAYSSTATVREINTERKVQDAIDLVGEAAKFFTTNSIDTSCRAFIGETKWRRGEIRVFVFEDTGICFVFGSQRDIIWKDFKPQNAGEDNFINKMLKKGKYGGFVNFLWNNGYMNAFVQTVAKDGRTFIIGAGFYPESGKYLTEQLVEAGVDMGINESSTVLFERINNPTGVFVRGNIYLSAYDMNGICVANGRSLELLGQNMSDHTAADGKFIVRDFVRIAKSKEGKGWIEYTSRAGNVKERAYASVLRGKEGKDYAIVGSYFPGVSESDVRAMVKKAVSHMRVQGSKQSFPEFSQPNGRFAVGGISLFVYDMAGTIVADMENPAFVGQNLISTVDQDGRAITRVIIQQAERYTTGWVSFHIKNAYALMYIEKVKLPDGDFVVGASYFPAGKQVTVRFMVEKATRYIEQRSEEFQLDVFTGASSDFLRGDVSIEILKENGTIIVDGPNHYRIWDKDLGTVDEKGKAITQKLISIAKSGGGWIQYPYNNRVRRVYAKQAVRGRPKVTRTATTMVDDRQLFEVDTYIVTSGYYL